MPTYTFVAAKHRDAQQWYVRVDRFSISSREYPKYTPEDIQIFVNNAIQELTAIQPGVGETVEEQAKGYTITKVAFSLTPGQIENLYWSLKERFEEFRLQTPGSRDTAPNTLVRKLRQPDRGAPRQPT